MFAPAMVPLGARARRLTGSCGSLAQKSPHRVSGNGSSHAVNSSSKYLCIEQNLMVSVDCEPNISFTHSGGGLMNGASHVENLGKSRYHIIHGLGHTYRFIWARWKWRWWRARRRHGGGNGKSRRGPSKRWRTQWRVEQYRSERGRQRFQGSRAAATSHKRPGDSAV